MGRLRTYGFLICLICACGERSSNQGETGQVSADTYGTKKLSINIMGPVKTEDLTTFAYRLDTAKASGVAGVTLDLWWGKIQQDKATINWDHYVDVAAMIIQRDMDFIPILSFHRCGNGPGDDCDVPLPSWVFPELQQRLGVDDWSIDDVSYKGESDEVIQDAVPVFATTRVMDWYTNVMRSFDQRFVLQLQERLGYANKAQVLSRIPEINISLGPTGELRYPSYDAAPFSAATRHYPNRGHFMGFGPLARASIRGYSGNLAIESTKPDTDFRQSMNRIGQVEGSDFDYELINWYQDTLLSHGEQMIAKGFEVFSGEAYGQTDIGIKIPGIHWRIGWSAGANRTINYVDRMAETVAGLLRPNLPEYLQDEACPDGRREACGYRPFFEMLGRAAGNEKNRLVLHFTAIEMDDCHDNCYGQDNKPKSLVQWIAKESQRNGIRLKGENALGSNLMYNGNRAFENIREAIDQHGYEGVTLLRIDHIDSFRDHLRRLTDEYR